MTDRLERWIDEELPLEGAGPSPVADLLRAARRGLQPPLAAAEVAAVREHVRVTARRRRIQVRAAFGTRVLAAAAAVMVAFALGSRPAVPPLAPQPPVVERVVVKHLLVESVHGGKVRRLEMTLHRVQSKEKSHVASPSL